MRRSGNNPERRIPIEKREIQKSSDSIHVEQMRLVSSAREAYGDDGHSRQELVLLPGLERQGRKNLVLADDDIRPKASGYNERILETDGVPRFHAKRSEEPREMIGEKAVPSNAERAQTRISFCHDEASYVAFRRDTRPFGFPVCPGCWTLSGDTWTPSISARKPVEYL